MEPVIAIISESDGGVNLAFENWELLVIDARAWSARHTHGTFPPGVDRITLVNPWTNSDTSAG